MTDLMAVQALLEEDARHEAIRRLRKQIEGDKGITGAPGTIILRSLMAAVTEGVEKFLAEANTGKAGRRMTAARCLDGLEPEVVAFIALKALMSGDIRESALTMTGAARRIGTRISDERMARAFEMEHPAYFAAAWKDIQKSDLPRSAQKLYLQWASRRLDGDDAADGSLSDTDRIMVGLKLLEIVKNTTGIVRIARTGRGIGAKPGKVDVVEFTPEFIAAAEGLVESLLPLSPVYRAMVVPPVPWGPENTSHGAYITHHTAPYSLVKHVGKNHRRLVVDAVVKGTAAPVIDAVNAVQGTSWRINSEVLRVYTHVYENCIHVPGVPRSEPLELPEIPEELEGVPWGDPSVRKHLQERALIHEENRRSIGHRYRALRTISLAGEYEKHDDLWFPHNLDHRGRMYSQPDGLHPQGHDAAKALLEFADGRPLGLDGERWLAFAASGAWGNDKAPREERIGWAYRHLDQIRSVAADPLGDLWWTRADSPFQFLALCLEFAQATPELISHIPVALDATCSGYQHYSAILRDPVGGHLTNMTRTEVRQDVYATVAKRAEEILAGMTGDEAEMARAWLDSGLLTRSLAKIPVMVKPYNGTAWNVFTEVHKHVSQRLRDGMPLPWVEDQMATFVGLGASTIWKCIPDVVPKPDEAMRWIAKMAQLVALSNPPEGGLIWETPAGFPAMVRKVETTSDRLRTKFDGAVIRPRVTHETPVLCPKGMARSTSPGLIHSLDAAHLCLTVNAAVADGITHFAAVHDSLGTHAACVTRFSQIIREQFVRMYTEHDVLADFEASALRLMTPERRAEAPPRPRLGELDIKEVLDNEYFFS